MADLQDVLQNAMTLFSQIIQSLGNNPYVSKILCKIFFYFIPEISLIIFVQIFRKIKKQPLNMIKLHRI